MKFSCVAVVCELVSIMNRPFVSGYRRCMSGIIRRSHIDIVRHSPSLSLHLQKAEFASGRTMSVLIPIANGSEELEVVTIADTLARAGARVVLASVDSQSLQVRCSRGVNLVADTFIAECVDKQWDMVVCPGGMPGAEHLAKSSELKTILHTQQSEGKYIGAICAAPAVVLAHHHLLSHKRATCYPSPKFVSALGAGYLKDPVVVDGHVITSQGPATALPFALKLVELLFGKAQEKEVRDGMLA